jgi:hypothetical protein
VVAFLDSEHKCVRSLEVRLRAGKVSPLSQGHSQNKLGKNTVGGKRIDNALEKMAGLNCFLAHKDVWEAEGLRER